MTLRELIRSAYQERVALSGIPEELKRSLKAHERIPKFFDNLERELAVLPAAYRTNDRIREAVYSLTDVFTGNVKRMADERQMSDLARSAAASTRDEQAKRDDLADRMNSGQPVDLSEIV